MKKILFLPFLRMSSGHHEVANSLIESLQTNNIICKKVDLFSYSYRRIEKISSSTYVRWIQTFPSSYSKMYKRIAIEDKSREKRFNLYELLFLPTFKRLLQEEKPDLLICTHALPSYLTDCLKEKGQLSIPAVNVYTDFFINLLWGHSKIDAHFVPTEEMKNELLRKGVNPETIFITGIPIHPLLRQSDSRKAGKGEYQIGISGGNLGAGQIRKLLQKISPSGQVTYYVLCGKNESLFSWVKEINSPHIVPLPYISSKEEMNNLYDMLDGMVTKPGGVTISECLRKKVPIFVYTELPGQEEINLKVLKRAGLVFHLEKWREIQNLEEELLRIFTNSTKQQLLFSKMELYEKSFCLESVDELVLRQLK